MLGKRYAGLSFLFFMATSPLILHYYSVPLPDTFSIALSMVALVILFYYKATYGSVFLSIPFLVIATLIKSPIVFIFILFYLFYGLFAKDIYFSTQISTTIRKNLSLLLLFVILLVSAISAELLRKYLLGGLDGFGFAQDPSWYFGTWDQRTQVFFWQRIMNDLDESGIYPFSVIYLTILLVSVFIERSKTLFAIHFTAILSFFAGWLIFSNLYEKHDYYKLPVTIVLFISLSVSLSFVIKHLQAKYRNHKIYFLKPTIVSLTIVGTLYILSMQYYISDREYSRVFSQAKDALKSYNSFLNVGGNSSDPTLGALLGTKYKTMSIKEFDKNCLYDAYKYQAIVIKKENTCLKKYRYLFNNIIELGDAKVLYTLDSTESNSTLLK